MNSKRFLRRTLALLLALVLLVSLPSLGALAEDDALIPGEEMLVNGDFSAPLKFQLYKESGGQAALSIVDGELQVDVSKIGRVAHAIQPYYDGFKLVQGVEYTLSFDTHSTLPRDFFMRIQLNGGDYHAYFERMISATEEMQHFSFSFVMEEPSDPAPRLCVNMGYVDTMAEAGLEPGDIAPHQVFFDNVSLCVKDASGADADSADADAVGIRLNQVGYLPDAAKTAVFADLEAESFAVVNAASGEVVLESSLSAPCENAYAGETDRVADFSALTEPGVYKLLGSDGTESPVFTVGEQVYDELLREALRMLYLQRCGTALDAEHAGIYAHPVCHSELALVYGTDQRIDVSGGWHDAGDYGRYVVPGAKAAADLLLSCELQPALLDDVGISESGDGVDDRLQEARYELDWLLKMQAESGGVYHKVTCRSFPGFVKPQEETDELVVCPISNTATADFAAVLALGARLFSASGSPELAAAAASYLQAAERAWAYLEEHPDEPGFTNPVDVVTGEYSDGKAADECFWAAAELARTTGKSEYTKAASRLLSVGKVTAELGWMEMGGYGLYALLADPQLAADDTLRIRAAALLRGAVQNAAAVIASHPYAVNRTDSYEWGSNMGVANDGVVLLLGASLLGDEILRADAARQLDYLLGENATGYCFVSGFGTKSPEHPHHRPSAAFGAAVPGMLAGGPDNALEDPFAVNVLADRAPAKCYADSDQSYSTNEVCIYWNSPLILLLCGLTAD